MSDDAPMKLTLTQGLLILLVATQIPVAVHYSRPMIEEIGTKSRLKWQQADRWKRVLELAKSHCTDELLSKNQDESGQQVESWKYPVPPVVSNKPKTREECLNRLGLYVDYEPSRIPPGLPWPPQELLY